jgi:hypothetical protein
VQQLFLLPLQNTDTIAIYPIANHSFLKKTRKSNGYFLLKIGTDQWHIGEEGFIVMKQRQVQTYAGAAKSYGNEGKEDVLIAFNLHSILAGNHYIVRRQLGIISRVNYFFSRQKDKKKGSPRLNMKHKSYGVL